MHQFMNTDNFLHSCLPTPWEVAVTTPIAAAAPAVASQYTKHEQQIHMPQFDQGSFMHMLYTMPSPAMELPTTPTPAVPVPTWYIPNCYEPSLIQTQPYYLEQVPPPAPIYHSMINTPPSPPLSVISGEAFMPPSPLPAHIPFTSSLSSSASISASSDSLSINSANTIFHCGVCTKQFTRPYNLKSHMRTHTNERPYACDQDGCPWKFARPHDLKRHQLLHSGHKPHECLHCEKRFARRDALRRHWKVDRECGEAEERLGLSSTRRYRRKRISKQQKC